MLAFGGQVLAHERSMGVGRRLWHGRVRIQGNGLVEMYSEVAANGSLVLIIWLVRLV